MRTIEMKGKMLLVVILLGMQFSACKKDDKETVSNPPPVEEQELITTFSITFTDSSGVNPTVVATFRDLDGAGGNAPVSFDTIRLKPGALYFGQVQVLNESVTPAINLTDEILSEAADHLFCYSVNTANAAVEITDSLNGLPIGLQTKWTTGALSNGSVLIRLKHQPGIKDGTCDIGETDIELNFTLYVE